MCSADDRAGSQLVGNQLDAWTAHKSEAGVVYYYNSVTGQSTYEKPPGFGGEVSIADYMTCSLVETTSIRIQYHINLFCFTTCHLEVGVYNRYLHFWYI